jgi:hypothetical protein
VTAYLRSFAFAAALAAVPAVAFADRVPDEIERAAIESVLQSEGFTNWGKIELDDNRWEVDNAVGPDGRRYDLDLDTNLNIVKHELED